MHFATDQKYDQIEIWLDLKNVYPHIRVAHVRRHDDGRQRGLVHLGVMIGIHADFLTAQVEGKFAMFHCWKDVNCFKKTTLITI